MFRCVEKGDGPGIWILGQAQWGKAEVGWTGWDFRISNLELLARGLSRGYFCFANLLISPRFSSVFIVFSSEAKVRMKSWRLSTQLGPEMTRRSSLQETTVNSVACCFACSTVSVSIARSNLRFNILREEHHSLRDFILRELGGKKSPPLQVWNRTFNGLT